MTRSRQPLPDRQQSQALKLLALLFMTVDHVGAILLPQVPWLRFIGRLAFPLFAYQLAIGYLRTRSVRRYALRLAAAGVIAQPVYVLAFQRGWWSLNIFATLLLGLLAIWGWDHRQAWAVLAALLLPAIQLRFPSVGPDYGLYGVLLCLAGFVFCRDPLALAAGQLLLHTAAALFLWPSQIFAACSLPLLLRPPRWHGHVISGWFFYAYYPAHLAVLVLLRRVSLFRA